MPEIEITPEQEERLRALRENIAQDVVGKYGHVRPCDAVEYLLDRYEADNADAADVGVATTADAEPGPSSDESGGPTTDTAEEGNDAATDGDTDEDSVGGGDSGGDDAMLNEMMNLLDTHDDRWGESSGDERYAVELPDGSTEHVRTKDDVKALLFKHYR
jgi:hypothetical protein